LREVASVGGAPVAPVTEFVRSGDLAADLLSLGLGELPEDSVSTPVEPPIVFEPPEPPVAPVYMSESDFVTPAPPEIAPKIEFEPYNEPQPLPEQEDESDIEVLLRSLNAGDAPDPDVPVVPSAESAPPEVISTDAYLVDFEPEVGLNNGLGEEIAALTGGDESRSRPSVVVSPLIDNRLGGKVLHRDDVVDRALVLEIIEGIEKL